MRQLIGDILTAVVTVVAWVVTAWALVYGFQHL